MSRPSPAPSSETFSGLLERLTGSTGSVSRPAASSTATELPSQAKSSHGAARHLAPVAELKAGRVRADDETVSLSYEQALRTHARYRPAAALTALAREPAPKGAAMAKAAGAASVPASATAAKPAASKPPGLSEPLHSTSSPSSSRRLDPAKQLEQLKPARTSKPPDLTKRSKPPGKSKSPAVSQAGERHKDVTAGAKVIPSPAPSATTKTRPARRRQTKAKPEPASATPPAAAFREDGRSGGAVDLRGPSAAELSLSARKVASLQVQGQILDFKRMTVSVRLSEQESELLRLRAAESGLSVSAYMRSCVLEADHLRSQVKQALAQMRSRTAAPEPARLPATGASRGVWSRVAQSAAMLLTALYPLRRSG